MAEIDDYLPEETGEILPSDDDSYERAWLKATEFSMPTRMDDDDWTLLNWFYICRICMGVIVENMTMTSDLCALPYPEAEISLLVVLVDCVYCLLQSSFNKLLFTCCTITCDISCKQQAFFTYCHQKTFCKILLLCFYLFHHSFALYCRGLHFEWTS